MRTTVMSIAVALALSAPCLAQQDDKAPGYTPSVPPAPGAGQPPGEAKPSAQATLTAADVERIVDAAVSRAMARQNQYASGQNNQNATASPQQQQAQASPQQAYQPPPQYATQQSMYQLSQTTTQQAQVLVPAGKLKQHLAAFGQHLANCAQPKVQTMTLAPVTYTTSPTVAPVATTTQVVSVPVQVAQPTLYTPTMPIAPATYYPSPQQQQSQAPPSKTPPAPRK